jgi:F-type H+-transporting ATPase subunit b
MKMPLDCRKWAIAQTCIAALLVLAVPFEALAAGGLVSVDSSLFIQIVNFLFLIWILNIILYRPIRNILIQRKEKFSGLEQGIDTAINDAKEKEDAFSDGIKSARAEGQKQKEEMVNAAAAEEQAIVERINEKAKADLAAAKESVAAEIGSVRQSLEAELDTFAGAVCEKILGRAV